VPSLVEFPLAEGGAVLVEVEDAPATNGVVRRGLAPAELVTRADETVEAAFARVKPAASALVDGLRGMADAPDEVQVTFGIRLSGEMGAVIAKTSAEANFEVVLRWKSGAAG
jgi:hypothetical protein